MDFLGGHVKILPANAGEVGSIPGQKTYGEVKGNPLQYS